jgi:hypothetical protein
VNETIQAVVSTIFTSSLNCPYRIIRSFSFIMGTQTRGSKCYKSYKNLTTELRTEGCCCKLEDDNLALSSSAGLVGVNCE